MGTPGGRERTTILVGSLAPGRTSRCSLFRSCFGSARSRSTAFSKRSPASWGFVTWREGARRYSRFTSTRFTGNLRIGLSCREIRRRTAKACNWLLLLLLLLLLLWLLLLLLLLMLLLLLLF